MEVVTLPEGCTPRQAISIIRPGEVFLMVTDSVHKKPVAQVCRNEHHYYVVGPRFMQSVQEKITVDQLVDTDTVGLYNMGEVDARAHVYAVPTAEAAMAKLQQLFKQR